jgi:hypothetical protein
LRHANDIIGQILIVAFFVIMAATPLAILTLAIINFIRAITRRGTIVLQALVAIAAWTILTYALVMLFIVIVFSLPYPLSSMDELKSTGLFVICCAVYTVVGALLVYWTKRQAKLSAGVSR